MNGLIDTAINRTRTTLLLMFMIVLAGMLARSAIPIASEPHIDVPFFVITIFHEGISPEDSERLLVMPSELELRKIEGVEELTAYASENLATLMVEFDADFSLDQALLDVREAMDRVKPELPSTAEEPVVQEASTDDFPIIQVNVAGDDVPERVLYNIAKGLQDEIESIDGVMEAGLQGATRRSSRSDHRPQRPGSLLNISRRIDQHDSPQQPSHPCRQHRYRSRAICGQSPQRDRRSCGRF